MNEHPAVIYLQKDKFDFFSPVVGRVIEFRFIPEIVHDLDVVNPDLFENLIKLFVENNKITPSEIIIVISENACFIKDFINHPQSVQAPPQITDKPQNEEIEKQINEFIEHVPFDDVASKRFPLNNGVKVWTANKVLFSVIVDSFSKLGFATKVVLPSIVFSNLGSKAILDPQASLAVLQSLDSVRMHNLLSDKDIPRTEKPEEQPEGPKEDKGEEIEISDKPNGKKSKKRLFAMIGVFVFLLIVLVFVYLGSLSQAP